MVIYLGRDICVIKTATKTTFEEVQNIMNKPTRIFLPYRFEGYCTFATSIKVTKIACSNQFLRQSCNTVALEKKLCYERNFYVCGDNVQTINCKDLSEKPHPGNNAKYIQNLMKLSIFPKQECVSVIAWGRVKLRFNFARVFKVSQISRIAKRRGQLVKL